MSAETALWSRESWESAPDTALLDQAREGSAEAFGELWRRHLPAAHGVAGKHGGLTPPEDIVAEAATKVFTLVRAGRGPDEHFRAYFLTTVRTVAADHTRRELRAVPVADDDLELLVDPAAAAGAEDGEVGGSDLFDTELVRTAFSGLPERDQQVLWHTTVEGEAPRVVAPRLGMTPGAVSSRALRARESLRAGYLDAYAERCLAHAESRECTWTIERLGRLVRGRLPRRQTQRAEAHVAACPHAAAVVADLQEIYRGFPALVVPLVLAAGFGTSGLAAALGFAGAGAGVGAAGAGAAALSVMGEVPAATGGSAAAAAGAGAAGGAVASESSQLATRLAVVLAGGVVALGLVAAALTSGRSDAPAPPVAAPTASGGPTAAAGPPASTTTSSVATPPATSTATTAAPTPTTGATTAARSSSASPARTGPTAASGSASADPRTAPTVAPRPTATAVAPPPAAPVVPPASGVAARLLGAGDPSRISLRVPAASTGGSLTVTISTVGGAGSLTVANRTFDCTQGSSSSLTCVGAGGQIQLLQSGSGGAAALVVRVRDASGAVTQSVVVPS